MKPEDLKSAKGLIDIGIKLSELEEERNLYAEKLDAIRALVETNGVMAYSEKILERLLKLVTREEEK